MGLTISIKGYKGAYDCGYLTFGQFRIALCEQLCGPALGHIYKEHYIQGTNFSDWELEFWNANCIDDLDIFLFHSDFDEKLTPKECKKIYDVIKDTHMDMIGHNYGDMEQYNMLERWKDMFKYCYKRRVNMYFR